MHDQFMLLKLVLNTNTMKFHKSVYPFSLFQQVPYFEQSNRKAYELQAFDLAKDFNGNRLYMLYDKTHHVASVFSLETEFEQRQIVPFKEAILGE